MTQEEKQQAHDILCRRLDDDMLMALKAIDPRLQDYFVGISDNPELHNGY